jgi:hypothetical protein
MNYSDDDVEVDKKDKSKDLHSVKDLDTLLSEADEQAKRADETSDNASVVERKPKK